MVVNMDNISFEDWQKVDIRVGTIKQALPHPDADKLTILKIDEGKEELRQLVAGIKEHYNEEELIEDAIKSIYEAGYPNELINVYVGSDGSTDRTINILQRLFYHNCFYLIKI